MILAGDVGGTKVVLALFQDDATKRTKIKEQRFASKDYDNFEDIVEEFLPENAPIRCACFGVAGPVQGNKCQATNLPWVLDVQDLEKRFNIPAVFLINDLEANAWGVDVLRDEEFYVLNKGIKQKGNKALISAGTGLGEAGFFFDGKEHHPFACEGGHANFSPDSDEEVELWRYLRDMFEHVSFERVLCGRGIHQIYQFFVDIKNAPELDAVQKRMAEVDPAQAISEYSLSKKCPTCVRVLDMFSLIYGGEAGNLALKMLAFGGVYIGGGIAPKIIKVLENGLFMQSFVNKGRFKKILSDVSVFVILNPETALLGAARYAEFKKSCPIG